MLGIGNPLLDGTSVADAERAKEARNKQACSDWPEVRQQLAGLRSPRVRQVPDDKRSSHVEHLRLQAPLPETADELCAAASELELALEDVLRGARATKTAIKRLSADGELVKYRVVHFATHGVLSGQIENALQSGLILTPPAQPSESDDGYLFSLEIPALKLDADWVILYECNTAGNEHDNDWGLQGLPNAFLYALGHCLFLIGPYHPSLRLS